MKLIQLIIGICILVFSAKPSLASESSRRIYLNGIDISSAVHQNLRQVNIKIDGQGNLFIEAPHYQVIEESKQLPLAPPAEKPPQHTTGMQKLEPDQNLPAGLKIDRPADKE